MPRRRSHAHRSLCRCLPTLGATSLLVVTGCVEPDTTRPWSTRDQTVSGPSEIVLATPDVSTSAIRAQPVVVVATEDIVTTEAPLPPIERTTPAVLSGDTPAARANAWLRQAITNDYSLVRAYGFEAMEHDPTLLLEFGGNGLVDENRGVRFVTTMAIGRSGLLTLAPLIEPGLLDESESVQAASIFTLRELGQSADPSPLATMAMGEDPEVRGNAFMVLGMLGNPSAISIIDASLGRGMRLRNPMRIRITELQAAEALVQLGDQKDVEPIRAALFAPVEQGELTVLACDILGRLQDEQARPMLMRLILAAGNERRPPEIRVAAATAILRLPPPHETGLEQVILEFAGNDDPFLRTQVAAALADASSEETLKALDRLLADSNPIVRTAAAGAILARINSAPDGPRPAFSGVTATVPD